MAASARSRIGALAVCAVLIAGASQARAAADALHAGAERRLQPLQGDRVGANGLDDSLAVHGVAKHFFDGAGHEQGHETDRDEILLDTERQVITHATAAFRGIRTGCARIRQYVADTCRRVCQP